METQNSEKIQKSLSKKSLHETVSHGTKFFPFAVYHGRIPEWLEGFPLHWHNEFEIILVTYGSGLIFLHGNKIAVKKDDIILIPPGEIHSIQQNGKECMAYYNIIFSLSLLDENPESFCSRFYFSKFLDGSRLKNYHLEKDSAENAEIFPLVSELSSFWEKDFSDSALLIKARIFEIIHKISKNVEPISQHSSSANKIRRLKKILSFMQENFEHHISIKEAASVCSLSESRFMQMFHQETGMSFVQYLNDLRLESSAAQLKNTTKSVTEIAFENGFDNISYFIRQFKRKYHCTPLSFRHSYQPEIDLETHNNFS